MVNVIPDTDGGNGGGGAFTRNKRRKMVNEQQQQQQTVAEQQQEQERTKYNIVVANETSNIEFLRSLQQAELSNKTTTTTSSLSGGSSSNNSNNNNTIYSMSVYHQISSLHFGYAANSSNNHSSSTSSTSRSNTNPKWCMTGTTTLYVTVATTITNAVVVPTTTTTTTATDTNTSPSVQQQQQQHIVLNLRGCCNIQSIQVETIVDTTNTTTDSTNKKTSRRRSNQQLQSIPCTYGHVDPMQHILVRPTTTTTSSSDTTTTTTTTTTNTNGKNDNNNTNYYKYHADSQSSRGAAGMTTALRAANSTSNIYGELHIAVNVVHDNNNYNNSTAIITSTTTTTTQQQQNDDSNNNNNNDVNECYKIWKQDLEQSTMMTKNSATIASNDDNDNDDAMDIEINDKNDHENHTKHTTTSSTIEKLQKELLQRRNTIERRNTRIHQIAQMMSSITTNNNNTVTRAYKVTIQYTIPSIERLSNNMNLGGLQVHSINHDDDNTNIDSCTIPTEITPYLYTVSGVMGDCEGPRCYLPCIDSYSIQHRYTHSLCITISSCILHGLSIIGSGDDYGSNETIIYHYNNNNDKHYTTTATTANVAAMEGVDGDDTDDQIDFATKLQNLIGTSDVPNSILPNLYGEKKQSTSDAVIIEPCSSTNDDERGVSSTKVSTPILQLEDIVATHVWCNHIWSPIPCRSIGFAIGPFKMVDDPEYITTTSSSSISSRRHFSGNDENINNDEDDDEDDDENNDEDAKKATLMKLQKMQMEVARKNGEGFRQVYLAPKFERKYIYTTKASGDDTNRYNRYHHRINTTLLPNVILQLQQPLSSTQIMQSFHYQQTLIYATTGVPYRAISLMRDILAVPYYRTNSYTQLWIPNAIHGGCTSGTFHHCPEVLINPFLGGAIMDSRLLPPVGVRLPYYHGGRVLQFLQARNVVRGWILAALSLGGQDDVGNGYILTLFESFVMSLYQRGHGGCGEGGGKYGYYFSQRYTLNSGLNSTNLDFLPVQNMEEEVVIDGVGAVPVEERHNEQLWRGASNGSESHSSAFDEYCIRQLLCKDAVEALERGTDRDKGVPSPSMGWFGSYLSLTLLSSNATSSTDLGCGAVDMLHPIGGLVYRALKCETFRSVIEGRSGVANFIRLLRVAFVASHLNDIGEKEVQLPKRKKRADSVAHSVDGTTPDATSEMQQDEISLPTQPFVICVNEVLKKKGLTHTLFTRALQTLSGKIKEPLLVGTLVDAERHAEDPRTRGPFVIPEGFPNSFVRGASMLFCRVGVQVEAARDASGGTQIAVAKGIQMQAYAESVIPEGGIAYGGPITIRVVENEGSFREYIKDLAADGSRRDWGTSFLHAKPVTTAKAQTAASGTIERSAPTKDSKALDAKAVSIDNPVVCSAFTDNDFHIGGYQSIELIRLTNLTPLLWVRVDPAGQYGGRISVCQPDACLAEQLFHDGDASAQVEAIRALAERPLKVQVVGKVTSVYDANVSELPVRVIGDCLRGSPALHSSLPHTPAVRAQAALAIAQVCKFHAVTMCCSICICSRLLRSVTCKWQNNKSPPSKDSVGAENWVGLNILFQYVRERFYSNKIIMPTKFLRLVYRKSDEEIHQSETTVEGGPPTSQPSYDAMYEYLDTVDDDIRKMALESAEAIELEEDEEYRVKSAVITSIACIRARDGLTPTGAIKFLETVLESEDAEMVSNIVYDDENRIIQETYKTAKARKGIDKKDDPIHPEPPLSFCSSQLVADTLLALCHVNAMPPVFVDPTTGISIQAKGEHPMFKLFKLARSWLEWELYRENIRHEIAESSRTGISGNCYDLIAASAIIAISNIAILIQSTTDPGYSSSKTDELIQPVVSAKFYIDIFDSEPLRNDLTRAACAQALACICCAADRLEVSDVEPVGLLTTLEFLLDRIIDERTSHGLKHTLALIMMDSCTGKVCSMQRVGAIAGRNDLVTSLARFYLGPLGACHGGDNGSAIITSVSALTFPAASSVNDGARRGMRLLSRAGHPSSQVRQEEVVRVAIFATRLWRTINGEPGDVSPDDAANAGRYPLLGVCAYNGVLRCSLLALWQWIWPKGCYALLQVQSWTAHENTAHYRKIGAHHVMKITDAEKVAATAEDNSLSDLNVYVELERDRQIWRGEMAQRAYEMHKTSKGQQSSHLSQDLLAITTAAAAAAAEKGIGQPLPPIARDVAFKQGGWIASAAQQRRALALDGGTAVTKLRLKKD